jgi:hypothetical protein
MEYLSVKITGLNGFEFFVGFESIMHDRAVEAKKLGVETELVKTNFKHDLIAKNIDTVDVFEGTINKQKIANDKQIWCLDRYLINVMRNPCCPTPGITIDMCA